MEKPSIILCGFMGSGKSTVGKILAQKSDREFVDLDAYIEQQQGMTISDIFEMQGEQAFRQLETEAARVLSDKDGLVLATGGGTVLRQENTDLLRKNGVIVLLDVPLSLLEQRLESATDRPLLMRPDRTEFMAQLHAERMPKYRAAAQICIAAGNAPETVATDILEQIQHFKAKKS